MTPYRPTGKIDPSSALMLLVATLAVGAAVGGLANVIGQYFRLIILFPLAMGFAVGMIGAVIVGWRRVQAPIVAGAIGLLAAMTAWGTDMGLDYVRSRSALRTEVVAMIGEYEAETGETVSTDRIDVVVSDLFVRWGRGEEAGPGHVFATLLDQQIDTEDVGTFVPAGEVATSDAIVGWVRSRLDAGTSIGKVGRSGSNVGPIGTAILWGVELLLAGGVGAYLLYGRAKEPMCQNCNEWYADAEGILPVAPLDAKVDVIEAIERGDPSRLAATMPSEGLTLPLVGLRFRGCPACEDAHVFTEVVSVQVGKKENEEKVLRSGLVMPGVARDILGVLQKAAEST